MEHTPKTFQSIQIYLTKSEESSRWILYSSLLLLSNNPNIWWYILHRISRPLKVKIKCIRVTTNEFVRQNSEIGGKIQMQVNPVGRQERSPPNTTPKTDPFFCTISKDRIFHILSSRVEPS